MIYKIFTDCLRCLTREHILLLIAAYCLNFISKLLDIIGLLTFIPLIGGLYGSENNLFLTNLNLEFFTKYVANSIPFIILDSLVYSSWLFLVASGLTLIYGVMKVLNIAHGSLYAFGAYSFAWMLGWFSLF